MKFLYIVNSSDFFCSHFLKLTTIVRDSGHSVAVACGDNNKQKILESLGFTFYLLALDRKGLNPFWELKCIFDIYKIIQQEKPDAVHMFTIKPVIYGGLINRFPFVHQSKINVASVTGLGSSFLSNSFLGKTLRFIIKVLYILSLSKSEIRVVFENEDDLNFFTSRHIISKKQAFIVNGAGIDTKKFHPSKKKYNTFTVVLVSRLLRDKGIREYIEAGKILKERDIDVSLMLVGAIDDDNISSMKQEEIEDAHSLGYINYMGYRSDINKIYMRSHVACLPSYREGLPKSLIEAASCGLAIVTTDVPGCRQMIFNNMNGILVTPYDANSIAQAIEYLVSNPKEVKNMGEYSRKVAIERFDYKSIIRSFFSIYRL